jgi:hypothetical protein
MFSHLLRSVMNHQSERFQVLFSVSNDIFMILFFDPVFQNGVSIC